MLNLGQVTVINMDVFLLKGKNTRIKNEEINELV
jgi:hypothetical protein